MRRNDSNCGKPCQKRKTDLVAFRKSDENGQLFHPLFGHGHRGEAVVGFVIRMLLRLRHLLEYFAVRVALSLIQAVRIETCDTVCHWLAYLASDVFKIRGRVVEQNLQFAFPEKSATERQEITRRMWRHLLLMICEVAHLGRKIHETNWSKFFHLPNKRPLLRALNVSQPKVCVTGHFGNFEALGHACNFFGVHTYTVARTLDNPYLDQLVTRFRQLMGQQILPKSDSAGQADEVLQTGGILALLGDQHAGKKGCVVDFLGRPASCHKALALFALLNRAPLMVSTCTRTNRPLRFVVTMDGIVDPETNPAEYSSVEELTQWYNDVLASRIRQQPEQYWWLHNRWREVAESKRRKKKTSAAAPVDQMHRPAA
jgi:KDO2-lipid IV(A) lauroyltransferase